METLSFLAPTTDKKREEKLIRQADRIRKHYGSVAKFFKALEGKPAVPAKDNRRQR